MFLVPTVVSLVLLAPCPAYAPHRDDRGVLVYYSCYVRETNTIYLAEQDPMTLWHERGHAYDSQALRPADRQRLRPLLGAVGSWWRHDPQAEGKGGAELFAERYAECALLIAYRNRRVCQWLAARAPYNHLARLSAA